MIQNRNRVAWRRACLSCVKSVSQFLFRRLKMLSQEQIDILTDMFGLEWGDYVEYLEDE